MVPACSSGTLTSVLPHRNAMPQTQVMTSHPITVYRHGTNLSLCYTLMRNVILEYTTTHFNVLGQSQFGNPSQTFHTHTSEQSTLWCWLGLEPGTCSVRIHYAFCSPSADSKGMNRKSRVLLYPQFLSGAA